MKSFLELVNFSARYIPKRTAVAEPTRRFTKNTSTFVWEEEQKQIIETLKKLLNNIQTLGHFRIDAAKTQLVIDASYVGHGAVLFKEYRGETQAVGYASGTFILTTEKEASACEKFHIYLYDVEFELVTDDEPLEILHGRKSRPNRESKDCFWNLWLTT